MSAAINRDAITTEGGCRFDGPTDVIPANHQYFVANGYYLIFRTKMRRGGRGGDSPHFQRRNGMKGSASCQAAPHGRDRLSELQRFLIVFELMRAHCTIKQIVFNIAVHRA